VRLGIADSTSPERLRGLSEAVTIMVVILVAVVVALAIKAWFTYQTSKLSAGSYLYADLNRDPY